MPSLVGPERRSHRRVTLNARTELRAGARVGSARCVDLSMGGLGVEADRPLPAGSAVDVVIELAPDQALFTQGEVVRSAGGKMGIRFVRLDQRSLMTILSLTAGG